LKGAGEPAGEVSDDWGFARRLAPPRPVRVQAVAEPRGAAFEVLSPGPAPSAFTLSYVAAGEKESSTLPLPLARSCGVSAKTRPFRGRSCADVTGVVPAGASTAVAPTAPNLVGGGVHWCHRVLQPGRGPGTQVFALEARGRRPVLGSGVGWGRNLLVFIEI
jgi:hypothetical protein